MVQISSVEGNTQLLDGGSMFGNAPRALWQRWIEPDDLGRIPLSCRSLYANIDGVKVLCETGIGSFFEPQMAERFGVQQPDRHLLLENLNKLGVTPDEIDFVILSHLHFDHAGGLLPSYQSMQDGDEGLNFKNATYVVGEKAFKRSQHPHFRDRASFIPHLAEKLIKSKRLLVVKEDEVQHQDLPSQISFIYSDGHTPGQMLTKIQGEKDSIIFTGDLVPGSHWVHLPITMGYDRFAEKVIDEKQNLYSSIDLQKTYLFFTHDIGFATSKIDKNEKGKFAVTQPIVNLESLTL